MGMSISMTRSTLWLMFLFTISGCDRQVNLTEESLSEPIVGGASVTLATNSPIVLPEPSAPTVVDTSDEQSTNEQSTPPEQAPATPNEASAVEPAATIRTLNVRLREPDFLSATAGLLEFYPQLVGEDGNHIPLNCCDENGAWTADVLIENDAQRNLTILWSTSVGDTDIIVLEADVQLSAASEDRIDISPENYNRAVDTDGDGAGNLTELVAGTNPLVAENVSSDFLSAQVRIPRVASTDVPIIDGQAGVYAAGTTQFSGEWAAAVHTDVEGNRLSIGNLMSASQGFATSSENHHWLALHDGTWLYVLIVIDDAGLHHFDSREVAKPWRDDGVEVYVDGDNSQAQRYDQVDDFSMHLTTLNSDAIGSNSSTDASPNIFRSVNSVPLPAGIVYSTGPLQGPSAPSNFASAGVNQDVYEIALRISDLNIQLGRTFGFEVQFNDDDDGADRDAKWGWEHPAGSSSDNDFTWRDPSFMGRAVLLP